MPRMRRWLRRHAANLLTAVRVIAIPVLVMGAYSAPRSRLGAAGAVIAFVAAAASDVWDGRVARRYGRASEAGRVFDHFADIAFLLISLATYVSLGLAPWWVPASIAAAFTFYVIDSRRQNTAAPSLIGSRIGHIGGICNYVLVGVLVFNHSVGLELLPAWFLLLLFSLVPTYSFAGMATRIASRTRP